MSTKSKKSAVAAASKTETLNKAGAVDLEGIRTSLASVKTKVARQLAEIEEDLVTKGAELQSIEQAIEIRKEEMSALHGADNVLMSIDDLRVKLEEERKAFTARKAELDAEIDRLRDEAEQARERDEAEYQYKVAQARKRDADTWNDEKAQRDRVEKLRVEDFERGLKTREDALAAREVEYSNAIEQAKTFDAKVDAEAKKQVAIVTNTMKKDFEHQTAITKSAVDAVVSNLNKDIEHRNQVIESLKSELSSVKAQLVSAISAQTDLAKSTVDNAKAKEAHAEAMTTFVGVSGAGNGARPRG